MGSGGGSGFGQVASGFGSGVPVLGDEIQNRVNRAHAREANAWAKDATSAANSFTKYMSDTAHQREVMDLRAAGLNPILSAGAGASTPNGPAASAAAADTAGGGLAKGIATALDMIRLEKELKGMDSQIDVNKANGVAALAAAGRDATTAKQNDATTRLLNATFGASAAEAKTREGQAKKDLQYQNFDNLQRRIKNGLDTINSGKDAVTPKIRLPRLGRDQMIINEKTGEILSKP